MNTQSASTSGVSAVILAGGQSRRMGRDKASLIYDGVPLIQRVFNVVSTVADEVVVVGGPAPDLKGTFRHIADPVEHAGPLAGLFTGLTHITSEVAIVVACDMPTIDPGVLKLLIDSLTPDADAVVPRDPDGHLQVIHAVYRKRCESTARELLNAGESSLKSLVRSLNVIEITDLEAGRRSWFNVNTPDDL